MGFVDAEGQGDKNITYDATLVCPILLASKCVIFNWKGDLQKDHLLETLGIMTKAAKNVAQDTLSEELSTARLTTSGDSSDFEIKRTKFSHLHIIFRDWQAADSNSEAVHRLIFDTEQSTEASTRNRIRREVLESFQSVHVWLFDAPTASVQELKMKLTIDATTTSFRQQLRELRRVLALQLREPTLFAGQPLTGQSTCHITCSFVCKFSTMYCYMFPYNLPNILLSLQRQEYSTNDCAGRPFSQQRRDSAAPVSFYGHDAHGT